MSVSADPARATRVEARAYCVPKAGSTREEYEDLARYAERAAPGIARLVLLDGATDAYDAVRWVNQLATSFTDVASLPILSHDELDRWFVTVQDGWRDSAPAEFGSVFEELKFHRDGSFATLLGVEVRGLDGSQPYWSATALGDTVLFHVRAGRQIARFPDLAADEFGFTPDVVHTSPQRRDRMRSGLRFAEGPLYPGDRLYLATDALAAWVVGRVDRGDDTPWDMLGACLDADDGSLFAELIEELRCRNELSNDDVTLLRATVIDQPIDALVVGR